MLFVGSADSAGAADPARRAVLAQVALMPTDRRENRWNVLGLAVSMTTQTLVFWAVFAGANAVTWRGWYGHTDEPWAAAPLEVTMLDADGGPVQRPGR